MEKLRRIVFLSDEGLKRALTDDEMQELEELHITMFGVPMNPELKKVYG